MGTRRHRHFNPAFAGAQTVFDAKKITGLSNSGSISTWSGSVGTAYSASTWVGGGFTAPIYCNSDNGINGNPAIAFNGSNQTITTNAVAQFRNKTSGDIFCVIVDTNSTGGDTGHFPVAWLCGGGSGFVRASIASRRSSIAGIVGVSSRLDATGANSSTGVVGTPSNPTIAQSTFDWANNKMVAYANGVSGTSGSWTEGSGSTSNTDSALSLIGTASSPATPTANRFTGKLSIIIAASPSFSAPVSKRISHGLAFTYRIFTK